MLLLNWDDGYSLSWASDVFIFIFLKCPKAKITFHTISLLYVGLDYVARELMEK